MFGEDIGHPVVPGEGVVVQSHVGGREAGLVHQKHEPIFAIDQFLPEMKNEGLLINWIKSLR